MISKPQIQKQILGKNCYFFREFENFVSNLLNLVYFTKNEKSISLKRETVLPKSIFRYTCQASDRVGTTVYFLNLKVFHRHYIIFCKIVLRKKKQSLLVCIKNTNSVSRPILTGVPQGSDLSPTIYNVYTPDKPITNTLPGHLC